MSIRPSILSPTRAASERLKTRLCVMNYLRSRGHRRLATFVSRRIERKFGVFIHIDAKVPSSCRFPHPTGIVIGAGAVLGERCTIFQNVTIGAARLGSGKKGEYPALGDDCTVFSGAAVFGAITLGDGCTVGANSVVRDSFPQRSVIVGSPARFVSQSRG